MSEKINLSAIKQNFDSTMTISATAYIEEKKMPLLTKAIILGKSAAMLRAQLDVKDSAQLNLLTGTTVLQDGSTCAWAASGTNTVSQRKITAPLMKVQKKFCRKAFWDYWKNEFIKAAATDTSLVFEKEFTDLEVNLLQEVIEKLIWQGDTLSSVNNLSYTDGLIKIIDACLATVPEANLSDETSITDANVLAAVHNMYKTIPELLIDKNVSVVCSYDVFRKYVMALTTANLYHFKPEGQKAMECMIHGTETKLIGLPGLTGLNRMFAAIWDENAFIGTDLLSDSSAIDFWYSQDDRDHKLEISFNLGLQVAFPDEIVKWSPITTITGALTTPAENGTTNKLVGLGTTKATTINVVNTTASVVVTGVKTAAQTLTKGGTNAALVTLAGTATAPTITINTDAIKSTGGSYSFTLLVSELGKKDLTYTFTVVVAAGS